MYNENITMPQSRIKNTKMFVEAAKAAYEAKNKPEVEKKSETEKIRENMNNIHMQIDSVHKRYRTFSETVRTSLVTEALYSLYSKSVDQSVLEDADSRSVMRNIVTSYVNEAGYDNILSKMRRASGAMSETYNVVDRYTRKILEEVDKTNPDTFHVEPEDRDEFFKALDKSEDSEEIAAAINDRVSTAMTDFVNANNKDHEDITAALQSAQEKIDNVDPEDVELKESYEMLGRRKINEIRRSPKNVFHGMVSSMCESILKHPDTNAEFINEDSHIDMDKVVNRVGLMYTFIEMLNTARIDTVDKAFLEGVIKDLAQ